jgi:hypothetical protein
MYGAPPPPLCPSLETNIPEELAFDETAVQEYADRMKYLTRALQEAA